jgi:hypothetical protein
MMLHPQRRKPEAARRAAVQIAAHYFLAVHRTALPKFAFVHKKLYI